MPVEYELRPEITGLGKARGTRLITQDETITKLLANQVIEGATEQEKESRRERLKAIYVRQFRKIGIGERGWIEEDEGASHLGIIAVRQAMEIAGITIKDVKSLVVATGLPDYLGVPTGTIITQELGGNTKLGTKDISGACPGFIHALESVIDSLSNPYGRGGPQVCVAAEPASKGVKPEIPETFVLFGDAAGAFIIDLVSVDKKQPRFAFDWGQKPQYREDLYVPAGGSRRRVDQEALEQNLDCIRMDGDKVKKAAIECMTEIAISVLEKANMTLDDIDLVIPHQANMEIIRGVKDNLQLPEEMLYTNIHRYGNTSAASIPVAMREAWEEGRIKRGDKV